MILLAEERGEIHVSKDPAMFEEEWGEQRGWSTESKCNNRRSRRDQRLDLVSPGRLCIQRELGSRGIMKFELYYKRIIPVAELRKDARLQVNQAGDGRGDEKWLEVRWCRSLICSCRDSEVHVRNKMSYFKCDGICKSIYLKKEKLKLLWVEISFSHGYMIVMFIWHCSMICQWFCYRLTEIKRKKDKMFI